MESKLDRAFKYLLFKDSYFFCLILKALAHLLSPFGSRNKITVLIYHHVLEQNNLFDNVSVDKSCFRWQMRLIKLIFNVITLDQAVDFLHHGKVPKRAIVITFDDGYADNLTQALPILEEYQLPCTFFIAGSAIKSGHLWNDDVFYAVEHTTRSSLDLTVFELGQLPTTTTDEKRSTANTIVEKFKYQAPTTQEDWLQKLLVLTETTKGKRALLTEQELSLLSNAPGVTIGCHTMTHPMFSYISADAAKRDVVECRDYLAQLLQRPIEHFAYPYGEYGKHFHAEHVNAIASLGFKSAVTTDWGAVEQESSFYLIKRFTPWDKKPIKFFIRLCLNFNK